MFIRIDLDDSVQQDEDAKKRLLEVCPVDIFRLDEAGNVVTVDANLDECTLSELCVQAAPGRVSIVKLYEE